MTSKRQEKGIQANKKSRRNRSKKNKSNHHKKVVTKAEKKIRKARRPKETMKKRKIQ